jgi:pimeloyl-ACP methyl ester carboxylesterase
MLLVLLALAACTNKDDTDTTSADSESDTDTDTDTDSDTDTDTDTDTDLGHTGDTEAPLPQIAWSTHCLSYVPECATIEVPYDHADPASGTFPLGLGRVPASGDPANYKGALFFNYGGGDSINTLSYLQYVLGSVAADYDLVSFDPRGGGAYSGGEPLGCSADPAFLDAVLDAWDGSTDPASLQALQDAQQAFFAECRRTDPEVVDHFGMNASADDMELVRIALGVDKISYLGVVAGGTSLGLAYAERYPTRVDRFVLDSILPAYGGAESAARLQVAGISELTQAFVAWCETDSYCAVQDDPMGALTAVFDQARTAPLVFDGRPLTYGRAYYGLVPLLSSSYNWSYLGYLLDLARNGDSSIILSNADNYFGRNRYGYGIANAAVVYPHVSCADSTAQPTFQELADWVTADEAAYGANGGITRGIAFETLWCSAFGPGLDPVAAPTTAAGAPPFLLVNSRDDGFNPLAGALEVQSHLENSSPLLIKEGMVGGVVFDYYGYCASQVIEAFFLDGTLPADGTVCE